MTNTTDKTLQFPIQITDAPGHEVEDDQLACEVRMIYVKKLNDANAGRYQLTERDIFNIKRINKVFRDTGYQTIDTEFS